MARYMKSGRDLAGATIRCANPKCETTIVTRFDRDEYLRFACMQPNAIRCLACRRECEVNEIYGRYVPELVCGAKCTGAVGNTCDCSCGGANHGGKWAA